MNAAISSMNQKINLQVMEEYDLLLELRLDEAGKIQEQPHFTFRLARFSLKEAMEPILSRWLQNICRMQERFELNAELISHTPESGFFLRLMDETSLQKIRKAISETEDFITANECPAPFLETNSYLKIPDLSVKEKAEEKRHLNSVFRFQVHRLMLIKKDYKGSRVVVQLGLAAQNP